MLRAVVQTFKGNRSTLSTPGRDLLNWPGDPVATAALRDRIDSARALIGPHIHRTPLVTSRRLSEAAGRPILLKLENLQKTGSFKVRGFLHKVLRHCASNSNGLLTFSSGNAAQGLAYAAQRCGRRAVVVMTPGANPAKVTATRAYGAEIVFAESLASIAATAADICERQGLTQIHPYDDEDLMIGHASLGLELLEDMPGDATVVSALGGGGMAGALGLVATACAAPRGIVVVEPTGAIQFHAALQEGRPVPVAGSTIAEGLCPPIVGRHCFEVIRHTMSEHLLVSDEEIRHAMCALLESAKTLAEPSGAVALAAALCGRITTGGSGPLVVIVSGGNIDLQRLKTLL